MEDWQAVDALAGRTSVAGQTLSVSAPGFSVPCALFPVVETTPYMLPILPVVLKAGVKAIQRLSLALRTGRPWPRRE